MSVKSRHREQGATIVVVVFILLVIVGGMLAAVLNMATSGLSDVSEQSDGTEALYYAESALERVVVFLNNDANACATMADGVQNFAQGSFEIVSGSGDSTDCVVKARGIKGNAVKLIEATLHNNGGTGVVGGGSSSFTEHFPSLAGWSWNPTDNNGTVGLDTGQNCGACAGSSGYSVRGYTNGGGGAPKRLIGYSEKSLGTTFDTTGGTATLDWSLGYRKDVVGSQSPFSQAVTVQLHDSTNAFTYDIWTESTQGTVAWTVASATGVVLPAGYLFDNVRVFFDLAGKTNRIPYVWIDEIVLTATTAGTGSVPDWQVVTWAEVDT